MSINLNTTVLISWFVHSLIERLHKEYPHKEWSGIARIEKKEWYYLVSDIKFPKQSNSWWETEMKEIDGILEDIVLNNPEQLSERKCWLHSHHNMWCFWSWTDAKAKASFNDWMTTHRWSIVTAYKWKQVDYKCALNIYKPINIEFDIPVKNEWFVISDHIDNKEYLKDLKELDAQYEAAYEEEDKRNTPTQSDILSLIEIFNVEASEENMTTMSELISDDLKTKKDSRLQRLKTTYELSVQELIKKHNLDIFADKLKELEDNIETYSIPSWNSNNETDRGNERDLVLWRWVRKPWHNKKKKKNRSNPYRDRDRLTWFSDRDKEDRWRNPNRLLDY